MSVGLELFAKRHMHLVERVEAAAPISEGLASWREDAADASVILTRWLAGVSFELDTAIAVSGVGDGLHLLALLERMPETGLIFCGEPDVGKFRAFLDTDAAVRLLEDERVLFGVGALDDLFFRSLASFSVLEYSNAEPLIFAPLFVEAEAFYSDFFLEFARQLEMWRKMFGTNLTQSGLWQRNSLRNMRALVGRSDPIAFQGFFEGVPLIMAGAGPSLDESLDFLRWAQDRAVIVAGNSSIRSLVRGGVRPHFVLAADPNPTTDSGFVDVDLGDTVLLCPFMVYPGVVERFGVNVSAWSFGNLAASHFRELSGVKRQSFFSEQGTVSACAFDLAVILGSPAVFFVGQDLCARADGKLHATDSFYSDQGRDKVSLEDCRWLPGNTLEKVPVEQKLFVYLKTFVELTRAYGKELKLKNGRGLSLYNLSRLGAKIDGMAYLPFESARTVLDSHRGGSVSAGWKRVRRVLRDSSGDWEGLDEALSELFDYLSELCRFALAEALAVESSQRSLDQARASKTELDWKLSSNDLYSKILNDGQLKMELHVHRRAGALLARRSSGPSRELESLGSYFWAIAEGSYEVLGSVEKAMSEALVAGTR